MKNNILKYLATPIGILLFSVLSHAGSPAIDFNSDPLSGFKAGFQETAVPLPASPEAEAVKSAPKTPRALKELTFMVFMNGKNDLDKYVSINMNQMEAVGSGADMNIVVEAGVLNKGVNRYYIQRDNDIQRLTSPVVQKLGNPDMGDWKVLADFAKWAKTNYPAKRYVLVVWNHGSGWLKSAPGTNKGISYDDETGNHISTPQLAQAMAQIGKVDIFATDACLMQMPEVIYEIKDYADMIVGSEETIPGAGYPYDKMLSGMALNLTASTEKLAGIMVGTYGEAYRIEGHKATLSAVRVGAVDGFLKLLNDWAEAAMRSDKKAEIKSAYYSAASYAEVDNKDLFDFLRIADEKAQDPVLAEKSKALREYISGTLVAANTAYLKGGSADTASHGVSIYLPAVGYDSSYDSLMWAKASKWDEMLQDLSSAVAPWTSPSPTPQDCDAMPQGPNATEEQGLAWIHCVEQAAHLPLLQ